MALPHEELGLLWPALERVELPLRRILHKPEQPISKIYFPETGYLARILTMADGSSVEVGLIGSEGVAGIAVLLGRDRDSFGVIVQAPGTALRMDVVSFSHALDSMAAFRKVLLLYVLGHFEDVARTGACNSRHQIDQRLARWLLMAHDRAGANEFPMTHEFIAMMLGVRRAGITVAAGTLQKMGLIHCERGRIKILDRPGLERATCECYASARRASHALIPPAGHLVAGTAGRPVAGPLLH